MDTAVVPVTCEEERTCDPESPVRHFPVGLSFAILDDSLCAQRLLEFYIRKWCAPGNIRCFGSAEADVSSFLHAALQHADIVIVDQHLEYSRTYLGTDLVRQLLANGFPGLVCIRSGDDSPEDRVKYTESGAHCSFTKDLPGTQLVEELKRAYLRLRLAGPRETFPMPSANAATSSTQFSSLFRSSSSPSAPLGRTFNVLRPFTNGPVIPVSQLYDFQSGPDVPSSPGLSCPDA
eukprot:GGOE01011338.1.p1 GENE.GGOE01011338.1~~GGOE01011338.1.p1  ORF type:complete len:234 (-),score=47.15 GGOE01011338.1:1179-1880(-)